MLNYAKELPKMSEINCSTLLCLPMAAMVYFMLNSIDNSMSIIMF